mgnify:CR=1 FL=1
MKKNFFPNKLALVTLVAACFVVNASMGVRQTFGLFSNNFEADCGISNTEFGLAVALHSLVWGIFTPIFGRFADQYGGSKIVVFGLICYAVGIFSLGNNLNTGLLFQLNLGLMVGIGLGACSGPMLAPLVTKHFPNENRSKAAGVVTACGGLGMFIFPILANIFKNISDDSWIYFLHSYKFDLNAALTLTKSYYGEEFSSSISFDNIYATQFHPEKSSSQGLKVLENFAKIAN